MTSFGAVESKEPWFSRFVDRLSTSNAVLPRATFASTPQLAQIAAEVEDEGRGSHEFERNTVYWMPDEMATYCYECQVCCDCFLDDVCLSSSLYVLHLPLCAFSSFLSTLFTHRSSFLCL